MFVKFSEIPLKYGNYVENGKFRGSARNTAARWKVWSLDISTNERMNGIFSQIKYQLELEGNVWIKWTLNPRTSSQVVM